MSASTELTVYDRVDNPLAFIDSFGKSIYESALLGCKNEAQGRVMALACLTEKKTPVELARVYHIIDGKLSMRADAAMAEFRKKGGKVKWLNAGDDGVEARAIFTSDGVDTEIAYTIEDAKRAKLVRPGSNWEKDPGSMLRARLKTKAVKMLDDSIMAGYYSPEELEGIAPEDAVQGGANGLAKRATVEELLAKSAANGAAVVTTASILVDKDVIDVEAEPAATTPPATPEFPACTAEQSNQIRNLFVTRLVSHEKQEAILAKYGANAIRNLTGQQASKLIAALESLPSKLPAGVTVASDYDIVGGQLLDDLKSEVAKLQSLGDIATMKRIADKLGGRKISQLCHRDAEALLQAMKMANFESFFARELVGKNDQPKEFPKAPDAPFDS